MQIKWHRFSGGKALTAEIEKGSREKVTSETQPTEGVVGRVTGAQVGAESAATRPSSESRVPSQTLTAGPVLRMGLQY